MRTGLALAVTGLLLAGCGSGPREDVRDGVAALTEAANARDAERVRAQAQELVATVEAQRAELGAERADRLLALARSVGTSADVIDADLLERRRAEAEAEAATRQLAEAQKQLEEQRRRAEEERRRAEEAAPDADQEEKGEGEGEGKGKGKDDEDD